MYERVNSSLFSNLPLFSSIYTLHDTQIKVCSILIFVFEKNEHKVFKIAPLLQKISLIFWTFHLQLPRKNQGNNNRDSLNIWLTNL